jgi:hypothetical protein
MRKVMVPILVLLLVAEITAAVVIVAAQPEGFNAVFGGFGPERRQELPVQTFAVSQGAVLVVDDENGKVEVTGTPGATQVTIKATKVIHSFSDTGFDKVKFEATQNGSQVIVNAKQNGDLAGLFGNRVDVEISVPEYMATNISASNGDLNMIGLNSGEARHRISNNNGFITLTNVKAAYLNVTDGNGSIRLENVAASLNAENHNGSLRALNSTLNIERVKNNNGMVELTGQLQQVADGSIEMGNGSLKLQLAQSDNVRFDITTGNGSINYHKASNFQLRSNHHVVTNGTGPLIRINSGNGSVTVD